MYTYIYIYLYITGKPISRVQAGRLQTSVAGSGVKNVNFWSPDWPCALEACLLLPPMQNPNTWEHLQTRKIVFLLGRSFKNHTSSVFRVLIASTSLLDAFQPAKGRPKMVIRAPPWRLRAPFASFWLPLHLANMHAGS